jgi:methyl halide transferase
VFIASALGLDTLGIDISPVGIENANEWVYGVLVSSPVLTYLVSHLASTPVAPPGKVALKEMDFFAMTAADSERYDVIYEYT